MNMDIAMKFGNVDALIGKAMENMKIGDTINSFKAIIEASRALYEIEISDHGKRFMDEIKTRRDRCASVVRDSNPVPDLKVPHHQKAVGGNNDADLNALIMPADDTVFLEDIVGLEEAKLTLIEAILLPVAVPDLIEKLQRWTGIVFYGTSGNGKSKVIKALNNSIKKTTGEQITFINLALNEVLGAFHGETEKKLSSVFKAAALRTPIVIIFDEIDSLCSSRSSAKSDSETKIINHFLTLLDSVSHATNLVVVGTTNKIDHMDVAFFRRFQKILYIELPDVIQREKLLESLVGRFQSTNSINFRSLAESTDRFSSADLLRLVADAVNSVRGERLGKQALRLMESSQQFNVRDLVVEVDYRPITEKDLRKSLRITCPTNTEEEIRRLDKFAADFCGRQPKYTTTGPDLRLPKAKMVLKKPGKSALMFLTCVHQFFGNGN